MTTTAQSVQTVDSPTDDTPASAPQESVAVKGFINRRRGLLAISGLLSAVGNVAGMAPYLIIYFIAVEILGKPFAEVNTNWLWTLAIVALGTVIIKALATAFATHISHIVAYNILYDLRIAISEHLGRLPLGYFSTRTTGEIKKVIHEDVEQMEEGLAHMIPDLIGGITAPLITVIVLFVVDWRLALATIALLPFAIAMLAWVTARSGMAEYNAINARINGAVIQYINGMKVLKTFLRADASFQKLRDVSQEMRNYYEGPYSASIPALAIIFAVVRANLLLIVPLGILFYLGGTLTIPTFVLFLVLGMGFNRPLWTLFTNYSRVAWQVNQAGKRIEQVLNVTALAEPLQPQQPSDATIRFQNVRFGYDAENLVL
ncbi:MAG: ABC transporter ATP-binding protein, partial [Chloroflexota bacterium]